MASTINGTAVPITIAQLISNKTGGAATTLAKNISGVTNLDIMSGVLDDAGFTISQNAGALATANSCIRLPPVGTATDYVPATITFSGTSITDNTSVRVFAGGIPQWPYREPGKQQCSKRCLDDQ